MWLWGESDLKSLAEPLGEVSWDRWHAVGEQEVVRACVLALGTFVTTACLAPGVPGSPCPSLPALASPSRQVSGPAVCRVAGSMSTAKALWPSLWLRQGVLFRVSEEGSLDIPSGLVGSGTPLQWVSGIPSPLIASVSSSVGTLGKSAAWTVTLGEVSSPCGGAVAGGPLSSSLLESSGVLIVLSLGLSPPCLEGAKTSTRPGFPEGGSSGLLATRRGW